MFRRRKQLTVKDMMVSTLANRTSRTERELRNMSREELYRLWDRYVSKQEGRVKNYGNQ